jgi:hypothetical protein
MRTKEEIIEIVASGFDGKDTLYVSADKLFWDKVMDEYAKEVLRQAIVCGADFSGIEEADADTEAESVFDYLTNQP